MITNGIQTFAEYSPTSIILLIYQDSLIAATHEVTVYTSL